MCWEMLRSLWSSLKCSHVLTGTMCCSLCGQPQHLQSFYEQKRGGRVTQEVWGWSKCGVGGRRRSCCPNWFWFLFFLNGPFHVIFVHIVPPQIVSKGIGISTRNHKTADESYTSHSPISNISVGLLWKPPEHSKAKSIFYGSWHLDTFYWIVTKRVACLSSYF